jgi:hypothetical protein
MISVGAGLVDDLCIVREIFGKTCPYATGKFTARLLMCFSGDSVKADRNSARDGC